MAQWALKAPHNPLFLLGPVIEPDCHDNHLERDIDVLFVARKSTAYVRNHLVPALKETCNVYTLYKFVSRQDLFQLYNRSRVYLYSSDLTEGFGFQPLEALISGCVVFSDIHGGLSDYLEPEINAFKLGIHSVQYDLARVMRILKDGWTNADTELTSLREKYSEEAFHRRIRQILFALSEFFPHLESCSVDIPQPAVEAKIAAWRLALHRTRKHAERQLRTLLASQ
jgi:glycosyltransferase involved in cell wall biosynthesis